MKKMIKCERTRSNEIRYTVKLKFIRKRIKMKMISMKELDEQIKNKKNITINISSKDIKATKYNTLPKRLKHDGFDGGDYERTTMSSRSHNR